MERGDDAAAAQLPARQEEDLNATFMQLGLKRGWPLGIGGFCKALDQGRGRVFAVKSIDLNQGRRREHLKAIQDELLRLQDLSSEHVAKVVTHQVSENHLHICQEFVAGGCMKGTLATFGPLRGPALAKALRGVMEGLCYLHTREPPIAHGRLKASNVLVTYSFQVKLSDIACSWLDEEGAALQTVERLAYLAPEVVQGLPGERLQADIWSAGCLGVEMASGERPWGEEATVEEITAALSSDQGPRRPSIPSAFAGPGLDFMGACFRWDAAERPPAAALLLYTYLLDW